MTLTRKLWLLWFALAAAGCSALLGAMVYGGPLRSQLLVGRTTSGHHQIELACNACHQPFGGKEALQQSCAGCHGAELKLANDSHPAKKFTDPRNADRLAKLNATLCVTCHREHRPEITGAMGVTLPGDYCFLCHQDIGKDRVSHKGLPFAGCTAAGCHNFHDNRALYEDFLTKHAGEPDMLIPAVISALPPSQQEPSKWIARTAADASGDQTTLDDWHETAHAKAGVNCKGCHAPKTATGEDAVWTARPGIKICAGCHEPQAKTFVEGKHGMRLKDGMLAAHSGFGGLLRDDPLTPMRPALARLPMRPKAQAAELTCVSCHGAHRFDTAKAQVESCLGCHADEHSKAYSGSPHHKSWLAELRGDGPKGSGVSCATCHMPRLERQDEYGRVTRSVTHNQNDTLRPSEKMIRPVCASCHGLQFSLDSLADPRLVERNFADRASRRVESIDWALKRARERGPK